MAGLNRKSIGAFIIDASESSLISPSRKRRSIAAQKVVETNIEENDDEAEKLARREKSDGSPASTSMTVNDRRQSAFGLSAISNLSAAEMSNQIAQCIKLNAENKINDKNAFQLKMIDFLVYALKKQDPNMTNLQMASASLDASAKIYGFRVDKVHSDLLKIIGMAKQEKKDQTNNVNLDDNIYANKNENQQKKKKKSRQHIIATSDSLKGYVERYDPLSLIRCQRDTQTSDMLFQASLPQHFDQGIALNLYNDVVLDKILHSNKAINFISYNIKDYPKKKICPSYAAFQFLDWSPDTEPDSTKNQDDNDGEYHFDLDAVIADDVSDTPYDVMMDCEDAFEKRCDKLASSNQHYENIIDFQDIIANNPNPNATYEYSYVQKSYRIHWAGPSHWKITLNKNLGGSRIVETCKQNALKRKKDIELVLADDFKGEAELKFGQINRHTKLSAKTTRLIWSEDKVTFPEDVHYDLRRYYIFFKKQAEHLKSFNKKRQFEDTGNYIDNCNISNEGLDNNENDQYGQDPDPLIMHESTVTQNQGAFIGNNLVSVPKLTDKIFISYSQRAKKIDMRQLKKAMWKILKNFSNVKEKENFDITQVVETGGSKDIEFKPFSNNYSKLPRILSKQNAESLSPAIAFVTLLHLSHEKNLIIERNLELSDLIIKNKENDNVNL